MTRGELRYCPECRQRWPRGAEFDVRSFRWLDDLPRSVSPSNVDCVIHDGAHGRDRFLVFETKRAGEPVERGQGWLLRALAGLNPERMGVRILAGDANHLSIHTVSASTIDETGVPTSPEAVKGAVVSWLNGGRWRDAEEGLQIAKHQAPTEHLHGWAKDDIGFFCVHCGKRWEQSA